MIRATTGVWMNYATTVAFQILIASRYGGTTTADVFAVVFSMTLGIGAILTSTVQAIVVPRLLTPAGELQRAPVRLMVVVTGFGAAVFAAIAVFAGSIASALGTAAHVPAAAMESPLRLACLFLFFQVVASQLISVSLALGGRFIAAVAPGLPSTAGVVALAVHRPSLGLLFLALALGASAESLLLLGFLRRSLRVVNGSPLRVNALAFATAAQFAVLNLIPPLERVVAAEHGSGGAASYNYAVRSLTLVQQLLVGGFVLSALGDWSAMSRAQGPEPLRRAVARTAATSTLLLSLAASIAVVTGHNLVALVYQHGAFEGHETEVVTRLLLIALPGFCAEGIGLVISQALIAQRKNSLAVRIGFARFLLQAILILELGRVWGVAGVAAAYSVAALFTLVLQVGAVVRSSLLTRAELPAIGSTFFIGVGTISVAAVSAVAGRPLPQVVQLGTVGAAFALLLLVARKRLEGLTRGA